jgi:hypothetical protein
MSGNVGVARAAAPCAAVEARAGSGVLQGCGALVGECGREVALGLHALAGYLARHCA